MVACEIKLLDAGLPTPDYARVGDAGIDLYARIDVELGPRGGRSLVPTGIAIAIPAGFAGLVLARSGLAAHHGVACLNAPGLVDSGYRGEVTVVLVNTDETSAYRVTRGDRIAQLVVIEVPRVELSVVDELPSSERGTRGFGHSGR